MEHWVSAISSEDSDSGFPIFAIIVMWSESKGEFFKFSWTSPPSWLCSIVPSNSCPQSGRVVVVLLRLDSRWPTNSFGWSLSPCDSPWCKISLRIPWQVRDSDSSISREALLILGRLINSVSSICRESLLTVWDGGIRGSSISTEGGGMGLPPLATTTFLYLPELIIDIFSSILLPKVLLNATSLPEDSE